MENKKIKDTSKKQRKINPEEVRKALGAEKIDYPSYNHDRADSFYDPCPICKKLKNEILKETKRRKEKPTPDEAWADFEKAAQKYIEALDKIMQTINESPFKIEKNNNQKDEKRNV